MPPCRLNSQPSPTASSTAAPATRSLVARREVAAPLAVRLSSGCTRRCIAARSSSGALRQMSVRPAMLNTCGQAKVARPASFSAPARKRNTASSDARARASTTPRESCLARCAIVISSPLAGISSQPST